MQIIQRKANGWYLTRHGFWVPEPELAIAFVDEQAAVAFCVRLKIALQGLELVDGPVTADE